MSFKRKLKSAWKKISSDEGVILGTVQIAMSLGNLLVKELNGARKRPQVVTAKIVRRGGWR